MNQTQSPLHILQQNLALDVYLRTLLDEVPEEAEDSASEQNQAVFEVKPETKSLIQLPQPAFSRAAEPEADKLATLENPAKLHPLSVMPAWAQHEFQALFFKVEHLILATPLVELSRTVTNDRKPGKIPGQPSWFMGLLDEQNSRIGVLDTGQLIFGKTRGQQRDLATNPFKRILITQDNRWGLACDEILSISKLRPEKVRWRTGRQKRPWLIGTVIDELTAIVDLQALVPHRRRSN